jgi:hypothetical protein
MSLPLNYQTLDPLMRILNKDDADPSCETVIYHYSPLASFISLLKSNRFWATNFRFLNDPTEIEYGRKRLTECLTQLVSEGGRYAPFADLFSTLPNLLNGQKRNEHQFIVSFTTLQDDLNFWRQYGDGGYGVSFGFRVADLVKSYRKGDEFGTGLRAVRYRDQEQFSALRCYIDEAIAIAGPSDPFIKTFLLSSIENFAPTFKPLAFHSECEWRLVVGNFVFERFSDSRRPLCFRSIGRNVLPYVEVDISPNANLQPSHPSDRLKTDLLPVVNVVVGSKVSPRDRLALEMALEAYGHRPAIRFSDIPIA